ncbi:MAG: hypothetical protein KGJ02_07290 [Verrucomicrobiota bacterium]|nr:hypothetical protein [Verrucomicrobiota bacterium]
MSWLPILTLFPPPLSDPSTHLNNETIKEEKFFALITEPLRRGDFEEVDRLSKVYKHRIQRDRLIHFQPNVYEDVVIDLLNDPQDFQRLAKVEKCLEMCRKHKLGISGADFWEKVCAFEKGHFHRAKEMNHRSLLHTMTECSDKMGTLRLLTKLLNHILDTPETPAVSKQEILDPSTKA